MLDQIQPTDPVDELLERGTRAELPAAIDQRMQARLNELRSRLEQRPVHRFARPSLILRMSVLAGAAIVVLVLALILTPTRSGSARVYAAAAAQLQNAPSLAYTIEIAPFTTIDFSYAAPSFRRVNCSWGIEIRSDGSGRELVLMHFNHSYVLESNKPIGELAEAGELLEYFRSLPRVADEFIGQHTVNGKRLDGYRVREPDHTILDLWIDPETSNPDHVDITIAGPQKPPYQMHIRGIRVDGAQDRSVFDMNPPAGYSPAQPTSASSAAGAEQAVELYPLISTAQEQTAVVLPMKGSYAQARGALEAVDTQLKELGVAPTGPAFGRFVSESEWSVGYPVPQGTHAPSPFQFVTIPEAQVATAKVKGPWGADSNTRWSALFKWIVDNGYTPAGPPTEIWTGPESKPERQVTEMRIAVSKRD